MWIKENEYIKNTGLSKGTLKSMRDSGELVFEVDWKKENKKIFYFAAEEKKEPARGDYGTATVVKRSPNINILLCEVDGIPNQNVRVKTNTKFIPGMTMRVRKMQNSNLWHYEENCPRQMGKW